MLCSLVFNYYYTNFKSNPLSVLFNKLCKAIYNYFKGLEYRRDIFTQQNVTKLQTIIDKNTEKLITKCLQILIKDLWHLQYGLNTKLRIDDFLYNKLIMACQEVEPYKYACYKLADTLAGFINNLRSSIIIYKVLNLLGST